MKRLLARTGVVAAAGSLVVLGFTATASAECIVFDGASGEVAGSGSPDHTGEPTGRPIYTESPAAETVDPLMYML